MDERPFKCEPRLITTTEELHAHFGEPVAFQPMQVEYECKEVVMEVTETQISAWEEPKMSPEDECLEAAYLYFLSIGCQGTKNVGSFCPVVLRLPQSATEWGLDVEGDIISAEMYLEDQNKRWHAKADKYAKKIKIALSDPESFPKLLAHMQKHSKFLRGGLSDHIPVIKAV